MSARSQVKKAFDFGRMRYGTRGPDIDTRAWVASARIDDDPDAIRWEKTFGWIVDVTFVGGSLDQDGPVACRVGQSFATEGGSRIEPFARGDHVLVLVVDGDPNVNPTIIGAMHNDEEPVPTTVNAQTIDEAFALANHILKTPHGMEYEVEGRIRMQSHATLTLISAIIELTQNAPSQAFVRGNAFATAMDSLMSSLSSYVNASSSFATATGAAMTVAGGPPTYAVDVAAYVAACASAASAISTFQSKLVPGDILSTKIKGE